MRLFYGSRVNLRFMNFQLLDDKANLLDQDVKNDSEFQLKFKKNGKEMI